MKKKAKKPKGIPFGYHISRESFQRNYDMLNKETDHMQDKYTELVIENNRNGSNIFDEDGRLVTENESQIKAREALHAQMALRDAIKEELTLQARKGVTFKPGRADGSVSDATTHIHQLVKDNRSLSAKELFPKANKSKIGDMSEGTFRNHVTAAWKQYPKEKKAAK